MENDTKPKLTPAIRRYFSALGKKSKGGGRPRIPDDELTDEQRKRRERYENWVNAGKPTNLRQKPVRAS